MSLLHAGTEVAVEASCVRMRWPAPVFFALKCERILIVRECSLSLEMCGDVGSGDSGHSCQTQFCDGTCTRLQSSGTWHRVVHTDTHITLARENTLHGFR